MVDAQLIADARKESRPLCIGPLITPKINFLLVIVQSALRLNSLSERHAIQFFCGLKRE